MLNNTKLKRILLSPYLVVFLEKSTAIITNLLSLYILSKYVPPDDFSTFAIVTIIINILAMVIDSGLSGGLIYKVRPTDVDYDTVFTFSILIAILLQIAIYLSSDYIARVYDNKDISLALQLLTATFYFKVMTAFYAVKLTLEQRFLYQFISLFIASLIGVSVAIWLAVHDFDYISLIAQPLVSSIIIYLAVSFSGYKGPSFAFDTASWREMFSFGSKISLSSVVQNLYQQAPTLIFGIASGKRETGFFSQSLRLTMVAPGVLKSVVDKVAFPTLTRFRQATKDFIFQYKTIRRISVTSSSLLGLILSLNSDVLIATFLGPNWTDSAPFLTILSLMIGGISLDSVSRTALKSLGLANKLLIIEVSKRTLSLVLLLLIFVFDQTAFLWSIVGLSILHGLINEYFIYKELNLAYLSDVFESFLIISVPVLLVIFIV